MIRKFLAVFCLLFITNSAFGYSIYKDVSEKAPYYPALFKLNKEGLMIGCPDGKFYPDVPVKRSDYSRVVIKALGLDNKAVISGVDFYDLTPENPNYDYMQIALYYDFLPVSENSKYIYPNGTIIRKYAILPLSNYLKKDENITLEQAKNILGKYKDRGTLRASDIIAFAKADVMGLIPVTGKDVRIDAVKPLTRADLAVLLYNISNKDYNMYTQKIEHYGTKQKGIGSRIKSSYVEGDYAIIPVKTEIPIQMVTKADSQKSQLNDVQNAVIPWNLVTKDKYLLIKAGSELELRVTDVQKRKFLFRNGRLKVESVKISTPFRQTADFPAVLIVNDKIGFGNKVFKFKRIRTTKSETSSLKLLKDIKVDLTSGFIVNEKL
ncbi:S-layer homology domain-containing protein [bacterium]|nr:S-layer homology domain-containing protein [bacterium]